MRAAWIIGLTLGMAACVVEPAPEAADGVGEAETVAPVSCALHSDCAADERCRFAPGSCGDAPGRCEPAGLDMADAVVDGCGVGAICGCDGRDYFDACAAWSEGVSVWFEGSCAAGPPEPRVPPPQDTTGPSCPGGCAPGTFCFSDDGSCGAGSCRPSSGTCTGAATPVCGCDGVTYDSHCDAVMHEASIAHPGAC